MEKENNRMGTSNVVLLHGLNNTGEIWKRVVAELPSSVHPFTPDIPALEDVDDIAVNVLEDLPDQFHLCGYSFGGYVALAIVAQAPERVLSLTLMGSSMYADHEQQQTNRKEAIKKAESGTHLEMVMAQNHLVFHPNHKDDEQLQEFRSRDVSNYGKNRFIAHQRASIERPDRRNLLHHTDLPIMILSGDKDVVMPLEKQTEMAADIEGVTHKVITETGHMMPLEQPSKLAEELFNWM